MSSAAGLNRIWIGVGAMALGIAAASFGQSPTFVNWETPQVHPIDLTPSGSVLVAVNTADNRLEIFDIVSGMPVRRGSVFTGLEPVSVRTRGESEAWVVNQLSDSVSRVDLAAMRVTRTVRIGDEPADIIFAGSPERAYVSLAQPRQLARFDPAAASPTISTISIAGPQPRALAKSPDGSLVYVAIFESGNHSVIIPRATVSAASGPYGGQNPPPNSGGSFVPSIGAGLPQAPPVAHIARKNAASQWRDGNNRNWTSLIDWDVLDRDIAVVNTATNTATYVNGLMTTVCGLGVASDGSVLAIGMESRNEIRFESGLNGVFLKCLGARVGAGGTGTPTIFDLNPHLTYTSPSTDLLTRLQAVGDPRGVAWLPDFSRAYIAGMGSNNVVAVSPSGARLGLVSVGEGPTGVVASPDGARIFVLNRFEGSISVVSTASNSETARVSFFDPTPTVVKAGRPLLYDTHATSG
ncbi:MAG: hypothetical protein EXS03_09075, partial [Phycisphaerales bacterium]|nr:hypothetical protein [Phycisphaerales bacterium]